MSALALTFIQRGAWWLIDCGEGTQHQILRSPLKLGRLEKILITHLHGDHVFGLPGLLASRSLADGADEPLTIYGPVGIKRFLNGTLGTTGTRLAYPLHVVEIEDKKGIVSTVLNENGVRLDYASLAHGTTTFGYAIVEEDKPGRLDVDGLRALGIPAGPLYARLKAGESVTLDDGRIVDGRLYVGPDIIGRKVVICGDTLPTPSIAALAANADVLIHEATFIDEDSVLARKANHSTARQAAEAAAAAHAGAMILTHFSPRYDSLEDNRMPQLLAEAKSAFPNTLLAEDFWTYEVQRRNDA